MHSRHEQDCHLRENEREGTGRGGQNEIDEINENEQYILFNISHHPVWSGHQTLIFVERAATVFF